MPAMRSIVSDTMAGMMGEMVAVGCAPHSGWAALVAVEAGDDDPHVVARVRIEMSDPLAPESRQPYHAVEGLSLQEASRRLAVYLSQATAMAQDAITSLTRRLGETGHRTRGVGILDSSGRSASLAATLASHALVHTADGNHFRTALANAAERCGLRVWRVRARSLETQASAALGASPVALRAALGRMGRVVGAPWAADQKAAALLAWVVLSRESSRGRRAAG